MRIDRLFWIKVVVLGLLLGLVSTVAVAWVLSRSHEWSASEYHIIPEPPAGPVMVHTLRRPGSEMVRLLPWSPSGAEPLQGRGLDWSAARRLGRDSEIAIESAHGWPLLCLSWRGLESDTDPFWIPSSIRWGLVAEPGAYSVDVTVEKVVGDRPVTSTMSQSYSGLGETVLPLRPLGWRFMLNTLFYSLVWWVPLMLPALLIRRARMQRGRCQCCAYPVAELETCPECGRRV